MDNKELKKKIVKGWIKEGFQYAYIDGEDIFVISTDEPMNLGDHYFATGVVKEVDTYRDLFPEIVEDPYSIGTLARNLEIEDTELN
ncbi:hypothetical protein [uncultured Veillonella sp.]|uniref:hypothetical protein n=1 Tax=uncultured Veillonella sp. TaxID=159268 RepID=UPI002660340E|nr:hypothetical protein [uncultured Veillonella sp.]